MSDVKITIKNLNEIKHLFKTAPIKMTAELGVAINRIIIKIERDGKKNAPVNKRPGGGNLRQSIKSRMTGPASGVIEATANYAAAVHEGTRPHQIRVRSRKVLADRRTGQFFGKVVNHPGTRAQPFLQKAVDDNRDFIDKEFAEATIRVFK